MEIGIPPFALAAAALLACSACSGDPAQTPAATPPSPPIASVPAASAAPPVASASASASAAPPPSAVASAAPAAGPLAAPPGKLNVLSSPSTACAPMTP
jgi:hypothetical protein